MHSLPSAIWTNNLSYNTFCYSIVCYCWWKTITLIFYALINISFGKLQYKFKILSPHSICFSQWLFYFFKYKQFLVEIHCKYRYKGIVQINFIPVSTLKMRNCFRYQYLPIIKLFNTLPWSVRTLSSNQG